MTNWRNISESYTRNTSGSAAKTETAIPSLNSIYGALLRMNRRILAEGGYGGIKWNRSYIRARRKGLEGVIFEFALISCGFNLHKYHLKKSAGRIAA